MYFLFSVLVLDNLKYLCTVYKSLTHARVHTPTHTQSSCVFVKRIQYSALMALVVRESYSWPQISLTLQAWTRAVWDNLLYVCKYMHSSKMGAYSSEWGSSFIESAPPFHGKAIVMTSFCLGSLHIVVELMFFTAGPDDDRVSHFAC